MKIEVIKPHGGKKIGEIYEITSQGRLSFLLRNSLAKEAIESHDKLSDAAGMKNEQTADVAKAKQTRKRKSTKKEDE